MATFFEANAGTGKTTRLTDTIVELIANKVPLDRICAVTFTEKAANEMVDRLRTKIAERVSNGIFQPIVLDQLNGCFIGTMHAFCTQVLRRYGERIGVPPLFEVDEGSFFEMLFQSRWDQFLSGILNQVAPPYMHLVETLGITTLEEIAKLLASRRYQFRKPEEESFSWLLSELTNVHRWDFNPESGWYEVALKALKDFEKHRPLLAILCDGGQIKGIWRNAIRDALRSRTSDLYDALNALKHDFTDELFREYRSLGYLRFDDLLIDTRDLLRNHLDIRAQLKERYDQILIDEMQDTDAVQYEIFLYLCERRDYEEVFTLQEIVSGEKKLRLQKQKLFVVGDPKQSIYGFRNADVGAYQMVRSLMERDGVIVSSLVDNQRSCRNIVNFTNVMARRLFTVQAPVDSEPRRDYCNGISIQECVHLIKLKSAEADAQHLRVLTEAGWLAKKVEELVKDGSYSYEDIGILLRKLTNAHLYVDALYARNIPIVIEGEKFFYQTQEVIDLLNLLKYIVDEMDSIALAGMLRSPLFGLNDLQLLLFFRSYHNDYNIDAALQTALEGADQVRIQASVTLISRIQRVRAKIRGLTPGGLLDEVFRQFPVLSVAVIAYGMHRRELAPLNILKIHKEALDADLDPLITADQFVRIQESYSKEGKQREQEVMADETVKAVRILSIHKSKGLDFSVVFVPLTDYGTGGFPENTEVLYDWQTDITGFKANGFSEANYLRLRYSDDASESAVDPLLEDIDDEEKRVLYVASTRAKKRMYFCFAELAAQTKDKNPGKQLFDFLLDLHPSVHEEIEASSPWYPVANCIPQAETPMQLESVLESWERIESAQKEVTLPILTTITAEASEEDLPWKPKIVDSDHNFAILLGLICHGVLERIDFRAPDNFRTLAENEACKLFETFPVAEVYQAKLDSIAILENFLSSNASRWLASVEILGREVPVVVFDKGSNIILTGKIDLVVREAESTIILDYKTASTVETSVLEMYKRQMAIYAKAITPLLPSPPMMTLCLLRTGELLTLT